MKVLEAFEANNTAYYSMEFLDGGSLDAYIAQKGGLPEAECVEYARQIGSALSYMHAHKMLHLDLKPGNVMLRGNGDAVLIDFGLSKQYDENGKPETSTTVGGGTPGYAPVEQADYREGKDFPVTMDVYALGATMFKMLTGVCPPKASEILNDGFPAYELQQHRVSDKLTACVARAMAPVKKDRPQSVEELLRVLEEESTSCEVPQEEVVKDEPVEKANVREVHAGTPKPEQESKPDVSDGKPQKKRLVTLFVGILVGITALVGAFLFWNSPREHKATYLRLSTDSLFVNYTGGNDTVFVETDGKQIAAFTKADWFTVQNDSNQIRIHVNENKRNLSLTDSIRVTVDGLELCLVVFQQAYDDTEERTIYYTTTNGKKCVPIAMLVERMNPKPVLISNTYEEGQGKAVFNIPITAFNIVSDWRFRFISSITIPHSVKNIDDALFSYVFDQLENYYGKYATDDHKFLIKDDTLKSMVYGFKGYDLNDSWLSPKRRNIVVPEGVRVINGFPQCRIKSLTLPATLSYINKQWTTNIYSDYFYGKYATEDHLALVVNGELIAFAQNDSLESYKIPSTVHTIGSWTMNGSLTTVYIPKNVTKIKKHAFANRKSIDCIYCESTTPPDLQDDSAFDTPHRIAKIYVPASAVDKYKAAGGWKNYADRIFPTDRDIN